MHEAPDGHVVRTRMDVAVVGTPVDEDTPLAVPDQHEYPAMQEIAMSDLGSGGGSYDAIVFVDEVGDLLVH